MPAQYQEWLAEGVQESTMNEAVLDALGRTWKRQVHIDIFIVVNPRHIKTKQL